MLRTHLAAPSYTSAETPVEENIRMKKEKRERKREKVCARVGGSRGLTEPVLSANLNGVLSISFSLF